MKPLHFHVLVMLLAPFLVAAAFHFTDWMGPPALVVLGPLWFGNWLVLGERRWEKEKP